MEMTFGSIHYNVNSEGILRLLEPLASVSTDPNTSSSIDLSAGLTDSTNLPASSTPRSTSSMSVGSDDPASSEMTSFYCLHCDTRHGLGSSDTPFICNAQYRRERTVSTSSSRYHPERRTTSLCRRQFLDMEKLIRQKQQQPPPPPPPPPQHQVQQTQTHQPNEAFPPPRGQMSMIHRTGVSRREMKKLTREINLAESIMANIPEYVEWSSQNITFSRADHPMTIPKPGHAALVVEAQIGGFKMSKVFMDGGSGLNLIFVDTIKSMRITMRMLEETDTCFHGILPTSPGYSLGKVYLNVVFGKTDNFRKEKIEFEVVNWDHSTFECSSSLSTITLAGSTTFGYSIFKSLAALAIDSRFAEGYCARTRASVNLVRWHAPSIGRACGAAGRRSRTRASASWEPPGSTVLPVAARRWVSTATHSGTPVGQSSTSTASPSTSEMAEGTPVTYEDLTEELKKKYDEVKAILEADLIGSFQRTRSHGIRWKGFSPEGALDGVDLSPFRRTHQVSASGD
ncbi:hypothetical protein QYE76_056634 [Lolium multiflorum]|uniref:Uncharacterized protein n=1 Tax=Lolium multiflorum TaxID=4521 RepID=A0AAD8T3H0_LOLMU|nr:hypothetical protein QYE76_056634 [Lolium multiflorum]